ncbi:winged helix DNA-binding domain-containing protein [Gordonia sinesedis]
MAERITAAQWNRTLLHRQHLLRRADEDAIEVIDRCVGLQSQDPKAAFLGLWSRIEGFEPDELDGLLTDRDVVRIALLRSTLFLIDAEDARWIRPLARQSLEAEAVTHARKLTGADPAAVVRDAAELLGGRELSGAELGNALAQRHIDETPATLTALARCGLPLVQVPPRGLWRGSGTPTYRLLDDWIGQGEPALDGDEARRELVRLYLRGFGPASIRGIQTWSGLRGLRPVVEAMESEWELVRLTGPDGEELFDLEGLDVVDGDVPAPVRLLAPFDHVLVAQGDRQRIADDEHYRRTVTVNGRFPGFILVDGRLAGLWRTYLDDERRERVEPEMFTAVPRRARAELDDEVARLEQWYADHS